MRDEDLEVIGDWPELSGQSCEALVAEQYWYEGQLDAPANVIWMRANGTWHRLCLDCSVVSWRLPDYEPKPYDLPELSGSVRLADLGHAHGLVGEIINSVDGLLVEGGAEVIFRFGSGRLVGFRNVDDHTSYYTG